MPNKRIKNWDAQSERLAELKIAIDHADFTEAKTILASILCPLISELTAYSEPMVTPWAVDRSILMRINSAGVEKYIPMSVVYTLIESLANNAIPTSDAYFRNSYMGTEYRTTLLQMLTKMVTLSAFTEGVDARITNAITTLTDFECWHVSTLIAKLQAQRIGKAITFQFTDLYSTGGNYWTVTDKLDSIWRPGKAAFPIDGGLSSSNYAEIYGDGTIILKISDANGIRPSGGYIHAA